MPVRRGRYDWYAPNDCGYERTTLDPRTRNDPSLRTARAIDESAAATSFYGSLDARPRRRRARKSRSRRARRDRRRRRARAYALSAACALVALGCVSVCAIAALALVTSVWVAALIVSAAIYAVAAVALRGLAVRTFARATEPALSKLQAILAPCGIRSPPSDGASIAERHARVEWTRRRVQQTTAALERKSDLLGVDAGDTALGLGSIGGRAVRDRSEARDSERSLKRDYLQVQPSPPHGNDRSQRTMPQSHTDRRTGWQRARSQTSYCGRATAARRRETRRPEARPSTRRRPR